MGRKEFIEELNNSSPKDYGKKYKVGKAGIYIGQSLKNNPEILAHEMGHEHYYGEGKKSLGGLLHKGQRFNSIAKIHSGLVGFHSGIKAAQAEAKGKKESLWNKTKSVIIPGIHIASSIGSEIAASAYGYKKLKEMGASEELLKDSRKSLRRALESHLADDLKILATGAIGRGAGILAGKAYYASKKKKADNKKKDEEENN